MPKQKKVLENFMIAEISAVDHPAQEHARAVLIKRGKGDGMDELEPLLKRFLDPANGAIDFTDALRDEMRFQGYHNRLDEFEPYLYSLSTSIKSIVGDGTLDGEQKVSFLRTSIENFMTLVRSKMAGIGVEDFDVEGFVRSAAGRSIEQKEKNDMDEVEKLKKQVADLQEELKKVTEAKEEADAIAKLSDVEKEELAKLDGEDRKAFLKRDPEERKAEIEKALIKDETIVIDGRVIRKSQVGDETFMLYKAQQDRLEKYENDLKKERERREETELSKRVSDEFSHLPGSIEEKVAVLKAVSQMDEPTRTTMERILKTAEENASGAFKKIGTTGNSVENSYAAETFTKRVNEIAVTEKLSKTDAMAVARKRFPDEFEAYRRA